MSTSSPIIHPSPPGYNNSRKLISTISIEEEGEEQEMNIKTQPQNPASEVVFDARRQAFLQGAQDFYDNHYQPFARAERRTNEEANEGDQDPALRLLDGLRQSAQRHTHQFQQRQDQHHRKVDEEKEQRNEQESSSASSLSSISSLEQKEKEWEAQMAAAEADLCLAPAPIKETRTEEVYDQYQACLVEDMGKKMYIKEEEEERRAMKRSTPSQQASPPQLSSSMKYFKMNDKNEENSGKSNKNKMGEDDFYATSRKIFANRSQENFVPPPRRNAILSSGSRPHYEPTNAAPSYSNESICHQRQQEQSSSSIKRARGGIPGSEEDYAGSSPPAPAPMAYVFGGVLTFTLYGTTEATDTITGQTYTEYILQCHWGPDLERAQPWVVARRYREFDALDSSLRTAFADIESQLPKLPPKEFMGSSLSPHVIARRVRALEVYLGHIVMNMPVVLRSPLVDKFLHLSDRVQRIQKALGIVPSPTSPTRPLRRRSSGSSTSNGGGDAYYHHTDGSSASSFINNGLRQPGSLPTVLYNVDLRRLSSAGAQREWEAHRPSKVNERQLEDIEGMVRDLAVFLRRIDPKIDFMKNGYLSDLCIKITEYWPKLKAMTNEMDFSGADASLIPRALQCDDDLTRMINDMRSLLTLRYGWR